MSSESLCYFLLTFTFTLTSQELDTLICQARNDIQHEYVWAEADDRTPICRSYAKNFAWLDKLSTKKTLFCLKRSKLVNFDVITVHSHMCRGVILITCSDMIFKF